MLAKTLGAGPGRARCSAPPVPMPRVRKTCRRASACSDDGYQLSEVQAKEILEMRLNRLTGLEQEKLTDEYQAAAGDHRGLIDILENPDVCSK